MSSLRSDEGHGEPPSGDWARLSAIGAEDPFYSHIWVRRNELEFMMIRFVREVAMPIYDYVCKDCHKSFEKVLTLVEHDKELIACPHCGSKNVEQEAAAFFAVTSKKS